MDAAEARERLGAARIAHLATVAADGRPRVVPFCFAVAGETLHAAVDDKPKTTRRLRRLDDIAIHPEVTVLVDHYDEDWSRLWWVSVRGRAEVVEDAAAASALLAAKYAQYRARPPRGPFIRIALQRWRWWSGA
jgi:PPOX class probable F420-dependent enzyme